MNKKKVALIAIVILIAAVVAVTAVDTFTDNDILGLDLNDVDWNINIGEIDWNSFFGNIEVTSIMILEVCLIASMALFGIGYYFRN